MDDVDLFWAWSAIEKSPVTGARGRWLRGLSGSRGPSSSEGPGAELPALERSLRQCRCPSLGASGCSGKRCHWSLCRFWPGCLMIRWPGGQTGGQGQPDGGGGFPFSGGKTDSYYMATVAAVLAGLVAGFALVSQGPCTGPAGPAGTVSADRSTGPAVLDNRFSCVAMGYTVSPKGVTGTPGRAPFLLLEMLGELDKFEGPGAVWGGGRSPPWGPGAAYRCHGDCSQAGEDSMTGGRGAVEREGGRAAASVWSTVELGGGSSKPDGGRSTIPVQSSSISAFKCF